MTVEWQQATKAFAKAGPDGRTKEPTSASVTSANDNYTIYLSNDGHHLIMTTTNPIQVTQNYKVLSIDKITIGQDKTAIVTLLRLK